MQLAIGVAVVAALGSAAFHFFLASREYRLHPRRPRLTFLAAAPILVAAGAIMYYFQPAMMEARTTLLPYASEVLGAAAGFLAGAIAGIVLGAKR